jgi:hypothetical protein
MHTVERGSIFEAYANRHRTSDSTRRAQQISPNSFVIGTDLQVINEAASLEVKLLRVVAPDGAAVYVGNKFGRVVLFVFVPLFQMVDPDFQNIVQFHFADDR